MNRGVLVLAFLLSGCASLPVAPRASVGFLAYNTSGDVAQADAATVDFDTAVYDDGGQFAADTFTAPLTGRYLLTATVYLVTGSATQGRGLHLVTSPRTYVLAYVDTVLANAVTVLTGSVIADLARGETASVQLDLSTGTVTVAGLGGSAITTFSGRLLP